MIPGMSAVMSGAMTGGTGGALGGLTGGHAGDQKISNRINTSKTFTKNPEPKNNLLSMAIVGGIVLVGLLIWKKA